MTFRPLKPVVPFTVSALVTLSACGGGGSTSTPSVTPAIDTGQSAEQTVDIGAAQPEPTTPAAPAAQETISGKVADGYLRGATVCIDLNENEACDDDEPQTISTVGGAYTLDIAAEYADKPILAEVPATAIDEDTGQPFGRDVIFSTPPERPEFISPLTTLVQQELKENPTLSVDDAEAALEEALGLDDSDETGLFKDYVALAEEGDEASRKKYRYLHQTARVVAGMMGDIRETVKDSVTASGVDIEGDAEARRALRKMVQAEVRVLIPEIAQAVANKIQEIEPAVDATDESATDAEIEDLTHRFNPDELIASLKPTDIADNATDRIAAIKEERAKETASMKDLLAQGFYTLDVDCEYYREYDHEDYDDTDDGDVVDEFDHEDDLTDEIDTGIGVILNDEGVIEFEELPEHCSAYYATYKVELGTDTIDVVHYYYDQDTGTWVEEVEEEFEDPHTLSLANGEWVSAADGSPESVLEYKEDGSAVISTDGGVIVVSASERKLDDTPVALHIRNRGAEPEFYKQIDRDMLFPADSSVYHLFIKRRAQQYLLFNWQPDIDDTNCSQFSDNCNLVDIKDDNGFIPVTTVAELQEASATEVTINEIFFDHFDRRPVDLVLVGNPADDGTMPTEGKARWISAPEIDFIEFPHLPDGTIDPTYPTPGPDGEVCVTTVHYGEEDGTRPDEYPIDEYPVDGYPADADLYPADRDPAEPLPIDEYPADQYPVDVYPVDVSPEIIDPDDLDYQIVCHPPEDVYEYKDEDEYRALEAALVNNDDESPVIEYIKHPEMVLGVSRWKLVEVDGQQMIEIKLPVIVRHRFEQQEIATFLLAEQDGYVRRGMRLGEVNVDTETAYSLAAFETLQPQIQNYVTGSTED